MSDKAGVTLAHYLEPGTGHTLTPARALRAVGYYLDRERPVAVDFDPTTIDVSGTGLPGIVVGKHGGWWWGDRNNGDAAAFFTSDIWRVWKPFTPRQQRVRIASGPETGPEARRLAYAALERHVDSKRGR
jgi:hypothetical protein